jgi:hypothetical protein
MRRWLWFAGLYILGIAVIGAIAAAIRAALL